MGHRLTIPALDGTDLEKWMAGLFSNIKQLKLLGVPSMVNLKKNNIWHDSLKRL